MGRVKLLEIFRSCCPVEAFLGFFSRNECYVRLGAGPRRPLQGVVVTAVAGPGVEPINDGFEFRLELRNCALKHALQGGNFYLMTVGFPGLLNDAVRPVFIDSLETKMGVKFRAKAGSKKTVAKKPA